MRALPRLLLPLQWPVGPGALLQPCWQGACWQRQQLHLIRRQQPWL
jgi:hypothetical protein